MRKCMKNFNFKLDYSEIDRIIEENDDNEPPQAIVEESKSIVQPASK